ncbi:cell wall mannoprotein 1 family protein [Aspergillus glaucus CBS 516.65]|uniref:Cell wall mannoprotein 1 n=1 Tax=Aspergillus glaucus CBS 516.65 TaxID=1160497 RepID=A0A1L9VAU6_ASPGL|nr:hypothetical protein ASPGLDRAFT_50552 [Aspergillus glaucus CBS 516.65]OJJ81048.1 hypothetical protein ASPGLDRAFT_50552 [Aspergillus glaucus CBS 516.65]
MKFSLSVLTTLALSANVLATPTVEARGPTHVERDLASITGVLSGISDKVGTLHTAINNYNGGDTQPVQSASDSLVDAINSGTTKVNGGDELNSMDALGLQKPVSDLKDKIQSTISDLNGKKQKIVDAGKGSLTYNDLQKQKTAALKLSDAIVSKTPDNLHDIAHSLASGISDAIQKGVEDFKDVANSNSANKVAKAPVSTAAPAAKTETAETSSAAAVSSQTAKPTSSSLFKVPATSSASSSVAASSSSTPQFTGAASVNKMSGPAGAVAIAAMVMAF